MFKWLAKDPYRASASQLYQSLVGRARQPVFYAEFGVPDTLDGRFEMITLHVFMAMYAGINKQNGDLKPLPLVRGRDAVGETPRAGFYDVWLNRRACKKVPHLTSPLQGEGLSSARFAQALFDAMFRDMEANLREMGVGDLSVPKKMKFMMRAFNGRCHSYASALRAGDRAAMIEALRRNVYGTVNNPDPACIDRLADYFQGYMEQENETHAKARMVV